jgi:tRNA A-37 threonylcarbamoyl transferase component Bud32
VAIARALGAGVDLEGRAAPEGVSATSMEAQGEPDDVARAVERALEEVLAGRRPDLEELARALENPADRARFRATALAEEYLVRAAEGGPEGERGPEPFLARLASEEERRIFREVLDDLQRARTRLPGELVPGVRLDGRYEIRREIGRGGMGIVYAAFDRELEREVAVKVLRPIGQGPGPGWEELFGRESKTLARLASRNIVAIHDARRGPDHSYIVMDLVRGRDLLQVLRLVAEECAAKGPGAGSGAHGSEALRRAVGRDVGAERADLLRERSHARSVARIARQIALTLEHAHGVGVIHRDLKPQNVLLVPGGEPVLLDFGLASWGREGTEEGFRGTPEYMAPEQIERLRAGNDPRTDVYQLGLVLYEMLALRRAFPLGKGEGLVPLFQRIQAGATRALAEAAPHAPAALVAIAAKAMARDPERRYQRMCDLREDLERFLARRPPKHAPLPLLRRVGLELGHLARRPATALVGVSLLAGALWLRRPPWTPPEFSVLEVEAGRIAKLEEGQPIELHETGVLGLEVVAESPAWLYVFQLFGRDEDRSTHKLRPVCPVTLAEYASSPVLPEARGLRLPPGQHRLVCAELVDPDPYEGLLVYCTPIESEVLAEWQHVLLGLERTEGYSIPYEAARQHLEMLKESVRGDPLGTIDLEARRRAVGAILAAEDGAPGGDGGDDWKRYRSLHRVEWREPDAGEGR